MERRTAVLAGLAVSGWAAFFASLVLRPGDGAAAVEPPPDARERDDGTPGAAADRSTSAVETAPAATDRESIADQAAGRTTRTDEAARFAEVAARVRAQAEAGGPCIFLREMRELGTERAKEQLLEWLADPEFCAGTHRSRFFAEALAPYDDPRIGPLAERMLERCIEDGLETEASGYVRLLASKGDAGGRRRVVDLLRTDGRLRLYAAQSVEELRDPALTDELLEHARESFVGADDILDGIVSWGDPAARAAVRRFAAGVDASASAEAAELHRSALAAYGRGLTAADLDREVSGYWTSDGRARRSVVACLGAAAKYADLDPGLLRDRGLPLVQDALRSDDAELARQALSLIESSEEFWIEDFLTLVEARANDPTLPEDERREARAVLARARRSG